MKALTKEHIEEHIAQLLAVVKRYKIVDLKAVFNINSTGLSFSKLIERYLHGEAVDVRAPRALQQTLDSNRNLDEVTVIHMVSAADVSFTTVLTFLEWLLTITVLEEPNKRCMIYSCHASCITDKHQELILTWCDWAKGFFEETKYLQVGKKYILLLHDY